MFLWERALVGKLVVAPMAVEAKLMQVAVLTLVDVVAFASACRYQTGDISSRWRGIGKLV